MPITDWPINERPREKLISQGTQSLSNAELLAIFLRVGIRDKTAVDLARDLLKEFGSLRSLFEANLEKFCKTKGLGLAKYAQLQAALEIAKRYLSETLNERQVISSSTVTREFLMSQMTSYKREVFACIYLDSQHRIIKYEELFHGSIDNASIHPREVVKYALEYHAAAVILAHNHPSGNPKPSQEDKTLTQLLIKALALIEVRVLDHIIIGAGRTVSFAELGLMHT